MKIFLAKLIASGIYSGYSKFAPGTAGSLFLYLILLGFSQAKCISPYTFLVLSLVFTILGIITSKIILNYNSKNNINNKDPQFIVIDEWAGLSLTFAFINFCDLKISIIAFILFRIFDAAKWGLVKKAEDLPGEYGIMADDIVAGIFAGISALLIQTFIF